MKHTKKKRILALVLCMVLVLSTGIAAFANENVGLQSVACSATSLERVIKNADGEQIGTLTADVPEGAFFASSSDANIQMEVEPDSGEAGVLNRVQQQMETEGVTGYEINNYVMTNVTFYVNGEKQTPQQPITFHVSGTNVDTQNVMAFADDRQNAPTLMDATTDENGGLQFIAQTSGADTVVYGIYDVTATEADETADDVTVQTANDGVAVQAVDGSTYTLTTDRESAKIIVEHYLNGSSSKLYRDSEKVLYEGEKITDLGGLGNYEPVKVLKEDGNQLSGDVKLTEDTTTYRVYYTAKSGNSTLNPVEFYDYQINPSGKGDTNKGSINDKSNYGENINDTGKLLAVGTNGRNASSYQYKTYVTQVDGKARNINAYDGSYGDGNKEYTGIITGINYSSGALKMGKNSSGNIMLEPGLFTREEKKGKQILTGYTLDFSKTGDTYVLASVKNSSNKEVATGGADFFPLDDLRNNYPDSGNNTNSTSETDKKTTHNDYFGMRYDVKFKIGDYLGDMKYEFTGDDDLWVVLDADKQNANGETGGTVVLDLGGIHGAVSGEVDIWEALFGKNFDRTFLTEEQRNEEHTLTVLYMERGATASNCYMKYTIPNAKVINSTEAPKSVEFTKVTSDGTALAGAKFGIYDSNDSLIEEKTSGVDGKVKFDNLYTGTYTVKEISAPTGYNISSDTWTVEVTKAEAKMYKEGDSSKTTVRQIVNTTDKEEAEKNLTSSKTAEVVDEDNRIFQINLNAATQGRGPNTAAQKASVVLTLDASSSLTDTDFSSLKQSAENFIDTLAQTSPESDVTVVWFNGYEYNNSTSTSETFTLNHDGVSKLKTFITDKAKGSNANGNGGTPMGNALKASYEAIKKSQNEHKYVVLFTDGMPGHYDEESGKADKKSEYQNYNCMSANRAYNYADKIKATDDGDAVIYTIGYFTSTVVKNNQIMWHLGDSADSYENNKKNYNGGHTTTKHGETTSNHDTLTNNSSFLENYIATAATGSNKYALTTSSDSELSKIFTSIASKIGELYSIPANKIVDTIDERFELTEASRKALVGDVQGVEDETNNTITYTNTERTITIVERKNGSTTITWTGDAAIIRNAEDKDNPGWNASFQIKAKDDFVGGNMIPTNGSDSGIYVDGDDNTKPFPQPSVNVKLLTPSMSDKQVTVYKTHTIKSDDFPGALAATYKITELDNKTVLKLGQAGISELTADDIAKLKAGKTVSKDYKYGNTNDVVGTFEFSYAPVKDKIKTVGSNNKVLSDEEAVKNHEATTVGNDVEEYELTIVYKPYEVKNDQSDVLDRTTILQTAGKTIIAPSTENKTITKEDGTTETIPKGGTVVTEKKVSGIHKVNVWSLEKISSSSTTVDGKEVHPKLEGAIFKLQGTKVDAEGNIIGVTYYGKSNSDGFVEWYTTYDSGTHEVSNPVNVGTGIAADTYELTELVAPAGYALNNQTWTIQTEDDKTCSINGQETDVALKAAYKNTPVYELPSTGGKGIFLYTIGGMLLMGAAAWILYKNKRREVLKR